MIINTYIPKNRIMNRTFIVTEVKTSIPVVGVQINI